MANTLPTKLGLKRVINASGRMSILGVSTPTDTVMEAMKIGGQSYVEMDDLINKSGAHVARLLGAEAALIVNSASSGIALAVAAVVTKGCPRQSVRLHQEPLPDNEIIMFKGHNVNYGVPVETMVYLGGGRLVEVGYANEGKAEHVAQAVSPHTAAILYVQSHHAVQKNTISMEEAWQVAQQHGVPFIVDAAAEEDLRYPVTCSDLVIYSGSKAIEGPTSGIVAGKRRYIEWLKVQMSGIGRSMKVGKEAVFGLLQALDEYDAKSTYPGALQAALAPLLAIDDVPGVRVTLVEDEAGRGIPRARVHMTPERATRTVNELRAGPIAIYTRDYGIAQGYFDIDPRPLGPGDAAIIAARLRELMAD